MVLVGQEVLFFANLINEGDSAYFDGTVRTNNKEDIVVVSRISFLVLRIVG